MTTTIMQRNTFYSEFDTARLDAPLPQDYRTPFEQDRDRIIHTSAFRRLQAKTQVFLSGEYDFYRTRLTHSLEVAQIGRAICKFLQRTHLLLSEKFFIDDNLVEAICLSHDLGHPPFGHAGERTLNVLMKTYGGFEGNAQTLRLLTETVYSSGDARTGMNPTRAFVDGVLKYKTPHHQLDNPDHHFIYDEQGQYVKFVFDGSDFPATYAAGKPRNSFRSIECQIMNWSDDVAYSLNDIADGIHSGFITKEKIERWASAQQLDDEIQQRIEELLEAMTGGFAGQRLSKKIGKCIAACSLVEVENFMSAKTNRYRVALAIDPVIKKESEMYKKLSLDLVFRSPQLHQLEKKGDFLLQKIFSVLAENYLGVQKFAMHLLPAPVEKTIAQTTDDRQRARLLCDYIAGMTDGFAIRTYKRLFDPEFGSVVDLV